MESASDPKLLQRELVMSAMQLAIPSAGHVGIKKGNHDFL